MSFYVYILGVKNWFLVYINVYYYVFNFNLRVGVLFV